MRDGDMVGSLLDMVCWERPASPGQEVFVWSLQISSQAQTLRRGNHHSPGLGIAVSLG